MPTLTTLIAIFLDLVGWEDHRQAYILEISEESLEEWTEFLTSRVGGPWRDSNRLGVWVEGDDLAIEALHFRGLSPLYLLVTPATTALIDEMLREKDLYVAAFRHSYHSTSEDEQFFERQLQNIPVIRNWDSD